MTRREALERLKSHRDEIAGLGVRSLGLFGSVARDEAGPDSDVDLLVEFDGPRRSTGTWTPSSSWKTCWGAAWTW